MYSGFFHPDVLQVVDGIYESKLSVQPEAARDVDKS